MAESSGSDPREADPDPETLFARRCCCCVWVPWPSSRSHPPPSASAEWWERIGVSDSSCAATTPNRWWAKPFLKVREWSEIVAGPRWKTFIRRFRRSSRIGRTVSRFQYDPLSYALNFDDGVGQDDDGQEEDAGIRNFSARFASAAAAAAAVDHDQTRGGIWLDDGT